MDILCIQKLFLLYMIYYEIINNLVLQYGRAPYMYKIFLIRPAATTIEERIFQVMESKTFFAPVVLREKE